jgi:hypothetical protein
MSVGSANAHRSSKLRAESANARLCAVSRAGGAASERFALLQPFAKNLRVYPVLWHVDKDCGDFNGTSLASARNDPARGTTPMSQRSLLEPLDADVRRQAGRYRLPGADDWHAHEMMFGFTVAVIAGFSADRRRKLDRA